MVVSLSTSSGQRADPGVHLVDELGQDLLDPAEVAQTDRLPLGVPGAGERAQQQPGRIDAGDQDVWTVGELREQRVAPRALAAAGASLA